MVDLPHGINDNSATRSYIEARGNLKKVRGNLTLNTPGHGCVNKDGVSQAYLKARSELRAPNNPEFRTHFGLRGNPRRFWSDVRIGKEYGSEENERNCEDPKEVLKSLIRESLAGKGFSAEAPRNVGKVRRLPLKDHNFILNMGALRSHLDAREDGDNSDFPDAVKVLAKQAFHDSLSDYLKEHLEFASRITGYDYETVLSIIMSSVNAKKYLSFDSPFHIGKIGKEFSELVGIAKEAIRNFLDTETRARVLLTHYAFLGDNGTLTPAQCTEAERCYNEAVAFAADRFGFREELFAKVVKDEVDKTTERLDILGQFSEKSGVDNPIRLKAMVKVTAEESLKSLAAKALSLILPFKDEKDIGEAEMGVSLAGCFIPTRGIDNGVPLDNSTKDRFMLYLSLEISEFLGDDEASYNRFCDSFSPEVKTDTLGDLLEATSKLYESLLADFSCFDEEEIRELQERLDILRCNIDASSTKKLLFSSTKKLLFEGFVGAMKIGISNKERVRDDAFEPMKARAATLFESVNKMDAVAKRRILECALKEFFKVRVQHHHVKMDHAPRNLSDLSADEFQHFNDLCRDTDFMRRVVNSVYSGQNHFAELNLP